ncbi:DsbA family protein [Chungangia koreensis]|uniref:DsbA family protein n=1 Tax=Chungangia koreensis TaxID=752657 RepID=A0ABV8X5V4_9LACT
MKIEVWSDYVCPFCYIGKRLLEQSLEQTGYKEQVDITFKAYELDPDAPKVSTESTAEMVARKYGTTVEAAKQMSQQIGDRAKEVGLHYNFDKMKPANTFDAHRLAKFAEKKGKEAELSELLLHSYFIEGKEIGRHEVLLELAQTVGLERAEAEKVLESDQYSEDVRADINEAMQIGVKGVPFFVLNNKYAISGAQPAEVFQDALRQVAEEEGLKPKLKTFGSDQGGLCTDGSCDI